MKEQELLKTRNRVDNLEKVMKQVISGYQELHAIATGSLAVIRKMEGFDAAYALVKEEDEAMTAKIKKLEEEEAKKIKKLEL
jgi:hypothetical protein